ncbi:acetaldehyde dehydrogenase (acetylating) [Streptomyces sp. B1866]|uniref:acetaldehyde dehydrogenase (acetylating) n=1 Tax=Streptomyces sp. B1866 TaxID=3075431 RepID=UPI00288EC51C|nr:acetaldehyde dehydrogenase (acetylating) [Streptomyces sp. B1866]MDT3398202.1 acetaldehyde dehydrogenase (acetylating) [Streptomyces sp. B1866]
MASNPRTRVAVLGSGNIGTDLMIKVSRWSRSLEMAAMAGVEPGSEGLARARQLGVATTPGGIDGLLALPEFRDVAIVFDATSAAEHPRHDTLLRAAGRRVVDLTPAALGPYVVPPINLGSHLDAPNVNMVTCAGQATIPIVAAVSAFTTVYHAEIVATLAATSAGPGTRASLDDSIRTTAHAIETVGGAARGKAVIILDPADPPSTMRDRVHCLVKACGEEGVRTSVELMVDQVSTHVPGYRLRAPVRFARVADDDPLRALAPADAADLMRVSVHLEVEGAAHYLPAYAGNLDIMTSAALRAAEWLALPRAHETCA